VTTLTPKWPRKLGHPHTSKTGFNLSILQSGSGQGPLSPDMWRLVRDVRLLQALGSIVLSALTCHDERSVASVTAGTKYNAAGP
jgi:hypothetical protein